MFQVLYNPLSGNGQGAVRLQPLRDYLSGKEAHFHDLREIPDLSAFLKGLPFEDTVVVAGGDGTLHRFFNRIGNVIPVNKLFYFAIGNEKAFLSDLGENPKHLITLNPYLGKLPRMTVNRTTECFLNAVELGLSGDMCHISENMRKDTEDSVPFIKIVTRAVLSNQPIRQAELWVDGIRETFVNLRGVAVMKGRYNGFGMNLAPEQERNAGDEALTVLLIGDGKRIRLITAMSEWARGRAPQSLPMTERRTGREIKITFSEPVSIAADGEPMGETDEVTVTAGLPETPPKSEEISTQQKGKNP